MSEFAFLTGPLAQAIGWALLHLLWQGAVVAGILAATLALMSRRTANARYAVSCGALALLLVLAVVTAWRAYTPAAVAPARTMSAIDATAAARQGSGLGSDPKALPSLAQPATWGERLNTLRSAAGSHLPTIVFLWIVGVALLSARLLLSWLRVHRLTGSASQRARDQWQLAAIRLGDALGLRRAVTLLESAAIEVPTVVGWMRPFILLPTSTLTGLSPDQIEMILAHELAHIRRHDFLVNLLQAVVETLMFYHPAVWWMSRRVRQERENCCDDLAVSVCGNALQYARALTRLEELRGAASHPALAANGGSLLDRIRRLVGSRAEANAMPPRWAAALGVLSVLMMILVSPSLPLMAQKPTEPAEPSKPATTVEVTPPAAPAPPAVRESQTVYDDDPDSLDDLDDVDDFDIPVVAPVAVVAPYPAVRPVVAVAPVAARAARMAIAVKPAVAAIAPVARAAALAAVSNIDFDFDVDVDEDEDDERKLGASGQLTVDELIALRTHGVTPEYINEMRNAGLGELSLASLLSLRTHGVTADYIREMRAAGVPVKSPKEIASLKIHGVSVKYIQEMRSAGLGELSVKEIQSLAIHGVNSEYVRAMRAANLPVDSSRDILGLKIHGVTPKYIQEMRGAGLGALTVDDIQSLAIHGVDADYVREIRGLGIDIGSAKDITSLKIHGVSAEFVRMLARAGYTNLSARDIARLAVAGVNSDFIRDMDQYRDKNGKDKDKSNKKQEKP